MTTDHKRNLDQTTPSFYKIQFQGQQHSCVPLGQLFLIRNWKNMFFWRFSKINVKGGDDVKFMLMYSVLLVPTSLINNSFNFLHTFQIIRPSTFWTNKTILRIRF